MYATDVFALILQELLKIWISSKFSLNFTGSTVVLVPGIEERMTAFRGQIVPTTPLFY